MRNGHPRFPWVVFLALAVAIGALAWIDLRQAREALLRRAEAELLAVADLKARSIGAWRAERLADVRASVGTPFLARAMGRVLRGDPDPALRRDVLASLEAMVDHGRYSEAILVDASDRVVVAVSRRPPPVDQAASSRAEALERAQPIVNDFAIHGDAEPHLHVVAPVLDEARPPRLLGSLALRLEARDFLYPLLARWPGELAQAESHLVQRMGDEAVIVDPVPGSGKGGMAVRHPMSQTSLPAVRAALGEQGIVRATDLRGVPVLAALRRVEGTGWVVTTQAEQAAVLAPLRTRAGWSIAASVLLVGAAGLVAARRFRSQGRRFRDLEAELQQTLRERSLDLLARGANDAVFVHDAEHRIVHANDRAVESYGYPLDELLRLRVDDLRAPSGNPTTAERQRQIDASPPGLVFESIHRRKDASTFPVEVSIRRFEVGGRTYYHNIVRDIAERRRMEAQLAEAERTAALGALAGSLAHDINNPLAYLLADVGVAAEALRAHLRTPCATGPDAADLADAAQALAEAGDGAERIRVIVRDLQAFARADGTSRGVVDLRAALRTAAALAQTGVRHRARLELALADVPPVRGDHQQVARLFLHLMLHAARSVPEGRASTHRIRVATRTGPGGEAVVEIDDTGPGCGPIDEQAAADGGARPNGGPRLAETQAAVRALGGELTLEPLPGQGCRRRLTLPAVQVPASVRPAEAPGVAGRSGRVLVVDDEPLVGKAVRRVLAARWAVELETSPAAVLRRLEAGERFDILVCDLMMPDMTGMELHARIAALDPGLAARTIFLTGGAHSEAAQRFLDQAENPQVSKPFDPSELQRLVAERMAQATASR